MSRAGLPTSYPVHIRCLLRLCQIGLMSPQPHIDFSLTAWLLAHFDTVRRVGVCVRDVVCMVAYVSVRVACFHEQWCQIDVVITGNQPTSGWSERETVQK